MLVVKKGDLFTNAPKGSFLLHACNAQGVWGSGVAKVFKDNYPASFKEYNQFCTSNLKEHNDGAVGLHLITQENVVCLVTSFDYGSNKDSPETIIRNTQTSLNRFFEECLKLKLKEIDVHSPKINSGLFSVPWKSTERLIMELISYYDNKYNLKVNWTVWEL